jgi:hypothetical protein
MKVGVKGKGAMKSERKGKDDGRRSPASVAQGKEVAKENWLLEKGCFS